MGTVLSFGAGASKIMFGTDSKISKGQKELVCLVQANKMEFKIRCAVDPLFMAKFVFAVSNCTQQWFRRSWDEVNDSLGDLSVLVDQILNNNFHTVLPPIFKLVENEENFSSMDLSGR